MTYFSDPIERDRVRSAFCEWLYRTRCQTALAVAVAKLPNDQFDALCALAANGYSGTVASDRVSLRL